MTCLQLGCFWSEGPTGIPQGLSSWACVDQVKCIIQMSSPSFFERLDLSKNPRKSVKLFMRGPFRSIQVSFEFWLPNTWWLASFNIFQFGWCWSLKRYRISYHPFGCLWHTLDMWCWTKMKKLAKPSVIFIKHQAFLKKPTPIKTETLGAKVNCSS